MLTLGFPLTETETETNVLKLVWGRRVWETSLELEPIFVILLGEKIFRALLQCLVRVKFIVHKLLTEQQGEFRQKAHLHHLAAEAVVKGEIEEETQSDVQEIFMFTGHQFGQLLYCVYLSLSEKKDYCSRVKTEKTLIRI